MCTPVDPSLLLLFNINTANVRRRPCNPLESALSPAPRKLAFAFVFLPGTAHFSVGEVLAFMGPHNAEGRMLLRPRGDQGAHT